MNAKQSMRFHSAANIFPIDDENLPALADDIKANGQQVPIELLDGEVLDGRRRWMACQMAGVKPVTKVVNVADPIAYVLSLNLHRRHLDESQRAMVGGRSKAMYAEQAKERQRGGQGGKLLSENLREAKGKSSDAAGVAVGVSGRSIDHATRVLKHGTPELVKAVDDGQVAVSAAARLATEPPETQHKKLAEHTRNDGASKKAKKSKPRGSFKETGEFIDAFDEIDSILAQLKGMKPKASTTIRVLERARNTVVLINSLVSRIEKEMR